MQPKLIMSWTDFAYIHITHLELDGVYEEHTENWSVTQQTLLEDSNGEIHVISENETFHEKTQLSIKSDEADQNGLASPGYQRDFKNYSGNSYTISFFFLFVHAVGLIVLFSIQTTSCGFLQ